MNILSFAYNQKKVKFTILFHFIIILQLLFIYLFIYLFTYFIYTRPHKLHSLTLIAGA